MCLAVRSRRLQLGLVALLVPVLAALGTAAGSGLGARFLPPWMDRRVDHQSGAAAGAGTAPRAKPRMDGRFDPDSLQGLEPQDPLDSLDGQGQDCEGGRCFSNDVDSVSLSLSSLADQPGNPRDGLLALPPESASKRADTYIELPTDVRKSCFCESGWKSLDSDKYYPKSIHVVECRKPCKPHHIRFPMLTEADGYTNDPQVPPALRGKWRFEHVAIPVCCICGHHSQSIS